MIIKDGYYSVYCHSFPNGKIYIGITKQKLSKRFQRGEGYSHSPLVYNAIRKHGWDKVITEIVADNLTFEEATNFERLLIVKTKSNTIENGYNLSIGGDSQIIIDYQHILGLWNEGLSASEICKITGHARGTIYSILERVGVSHEEKVFRGNSKAKRKFDRADIANAYINSNSTIETIAKIFGCSINTVRRSLQENGISASQRLERRNNRGKNK